MRRIFQLGTLLLMLTVCLAPVFEFFDRWDDPGLGSDTELTVFCLVFLLCLLLAACTVVHCLTGPLAKDPIAALPLEQNVRWKLELFYALEPFLPPIAAPLRI